jgi:hypothetical protein
MLLRRTYTPYTRYGSSSSSDVSVPSLNCAPETTWAGNGDEIFGRKQVGQTVDQQRQDQVELAK